mmetsp:Transcript_9250/g.28384  ORF Transcript_9250/g.28384 Transcript_9250/m.28384 type:complete len:263 (+) Transcript_9250:231-1019(+)
MQNETRSISSPDVITYADATPMMSATMLVSTTMARGSSTTSRKYGVGALSIKPSKNPRMREVTSSLRVIRYCIVSVATFSLESSILLTPRKMDVTAVLNIEISSTDDEPDDLLALPVSSGVRPSEVARLLLLTGRDDAEPPHRRPPAARTMIAKRGKGAPRRSSKVPGVGPQKRARRHDVRDECREEESSKEGRQSPGVVGEQAQWPADERAEFLHHRTRVLRQPVEDALVREPRLLADGYLDPSGVESEPRDREALKRLVS